MSNEYPKPGSRWVHKNGIVYEVLLLTNLYGNRPEYPTTVVYFNVENKTNWSRPLTEWSRSFTPQ